MNRKEQAWEALLRRIEAKELSLERAVLAGFNAGYHAGFLDGSSSDSALEPEPAPPAAPARPEKARAGAG